MDEFDEWLRENTVYPDSGTLFVAILMKVGRVQPEQYVHEWEYSTGKYVIQLHKELNMQVDPDWFEYRWWDWYDEEADDGQRTGVHSGLDVSRSQTT